MFRTESCRNLQIYFNNPLEDPLDQKSSKQMINDLALTIIFNRLSEQISE